MKTVMVTGSTGYLGSVLTQVLKVAGYHCIGYDTGFFRQALLTPAADTNTVWKDARDITGDDLDGVDAVVHLAGISNDPMGALDAARVYDPTRAYTASLASLCKARGIRFIFASSCSIYGLGAEDLLDEDSDTHPQTPYSVNKLQIEQDLAAMSDASFSPIALRFATVFGPSPRIRFDVVINMLVGMAVSSGRIVLNSDGMSWRPNLHILDLCESVRCAIESNHRGGGLLVLNVGADENNLRVLDIARIVEGAVPGCELKFLAQNPELDKDGLIRDRKVQGKDTRTYRVSFDRIRTAFPEFECRWSVERGVRELVPVLQQAGLSHARFTDRGFYRLQQLEYLHSGGYLSDELRWLKAPPV
jgi:nucleoside-diphosphate-sugar epimerase